MQKAIKYSCLGLMLLVAQEVNAQSSTFDTDGFWNFATNWSNGIPSATRNAIIDEEVICTVTLNSECKDLTLKDLSVLGINADDTLSVNGKLNIQGEASLINTGLILLDGNLQYDGSDRITIGGSLEMHSGIELVEIEFEFEGQD